MYPSFRELFFDDKIFNQFEFFLSEDVKLSFAAISYL